MMKRILTVAALLFALVFANAQGGRLPAPNSPEANKANLEAKARKAVDQLTTQLTLSKVQSDKLYTISVNFYNERQALASLKESNPAAYKTKMRERGNYYVEQVNAFLTPEQQKIFNSLIAEKEKEAK